MKKLLIVVLSVVLLSGCGILDRGNYDKNRSGYVLSGDFIVSYHTNSIGEIDVFQLDKIMTYFQAIDYVDFDIDLLGEHDTLNAFVSVEELSACGETSESSIPRFIRIGDESYYYNVRDNGYCTFDQYEFYKDGYSNLTSYVTEDTSPIKNLNITLFKSADFNVNTFDNIVFIENVYYEPISGVWVKQLVEPLPMSMKQSGNVIEDNTDYIYQLSIFESYVLDNQSINLLILREDYLDPDVNNIWSEGTIEALGRNHDLVKKVRLEDSTEIIAIINDTLGRLGMFQ